MLLFWFMVYVGMHWKLRNLIFYVVILVHFWQLWKSLKLSYSYVILAWY